MADTKAWLSFSEKLIQVGYSIFATASVPVTEEGAGDIKILACTLLARTISNLKGVVILAREGRVVETRTIARSCYENQYWVGGLLNEGDKFARRMLHDEIKHRQMRGEWLMRSDAEINQEIETNLRKWMKESNKKFPNVKSLNPKEVADKSPIGQSYIFYAQLSSDAAHPSIDALNRYIVSSMEDGETIRGFDVEPVLRPNEIADTINLACLAVIGVFVGVNEILGGTAGGQQLSKIADEYTRLTEERIDKDQQTKTP